MLLIYGGNMKIYFFVISSLFFFSFDLLAGENECKLVVHQFGSGKYGDMYVNVKPNTKEGDKVGEIRYHQSLFDDEVECKKDNIYYGRIFARRGQELIEKYKDIDGHPAWYLPLTDKQYAFTLINSESNDYYSDYNVITIQSNGEFGNKNAVAYIYAAKDNPKSINKSGVGVTLAIDSITKYGQEGEGSLFYYLPMDFVIEEGPVMCTIEPDSEDIILDLPRISLAKFDDVGFPSQNVSATKNININCTGEMSASFTLNATNVSQTNEGSVIIPDDEGKNGHANGIGFVLSIDGDDGFISNGDKLQLKKREVGKSSISLTSRYYRYNPNDGELKSGVMSATSSFTLQFD